MEYHPGTKVDPGYFVKRSYKKKRGGGCEMQDGMILILQRSARRGS